MPTSLLLSVIICTYNPRRDYLRRTLDALATQTLPEDRWELLLIDNASTEPLADSVDLSWHPAARIVREDRLGLNRARLRGIAETTAPTLVFVDDDNVLAPDYLAEAERIASVMPFVGAWGGAVEPEFETPPPPWLGPYLPLLAVNPVPRDVWSNLADPSGTPPCGAGLCVRRPVAEHWAQAAIDDPRRLSLDRTGTSLTSCGDIDLAFTACDMGLAAGRFRALRLVHLIPARRLQLDYMARLVEEVAASQVVFRALRETLASPPPPRILPRLLRLWTRLRMDPAIMRLNEAAERGRRRGFVALAAPR